MSEHLTGKDNYFEDFAPGQAFRHARGKTVGATENVLLTHLVMNTADGHFNEAKMAPVGGVISFGGVNFSIVIGLAAQDTAENALEEVGLDKIRLKAPVHHGDTLHAISEVLEVTDEGDPRAGLIRFRHTGINQKGVVVAELERLVRIKKRAHWCKA